MKEHQWSSEERRQRLAILVRQAPFLFAANVGNACIIAALVGGDVPAAFLWPWFAAAFLVAFYPLRAWWSGRRKTGRGSGSVRSMRRAAWQAAAAATIWGAASPLFAPHVSSDVNLMLHGMLGCIAVGGAVGLSAVPAAALGYSAILGAAPLVYFFGFAPGSQLWLGFGLLLFLMTVWAATRSVLWAASVATRRVADEAAQRTRAGARFEDSDFSSGTLDITRYLWAPALGCYGIQRIDAVRDTMIVAGAGVGGGSLGYANTLYEPLPAFYNDPQWSHITDWKSELAPYYDQAKRMLGVVENPVRTPADGFRPGRSSRRVRQRNADVDGREQPPVALGSHYALFRRYVCSRHGDGGMAAMSHEDYRAMVQETPVPSRLIEFRSDDRLYGVCLTDRLDDGLSLVYSYFDPDRADDSPGTFIILWHIEQARRLGLPYVYLGYWISQSRKMAYKRGFAALEALTPQGWRPLPPA